MHFPKMPDFIHDTDGGKSILYIEDDVVVLTAYRERLQQAGFDVEGSVDGLEAMRILAARVFDLIVLDLMLPRLGGGEILRAIRANPRLKAILVVIFSGNLKAVPLAEAELADRFLLKGDCAFSTLLQTIRELLAGNPGDDISRNN
jgi:CheY-like chemotaxis protein